MLGDFYKADELVAESSREIQLNYQQNPGWLSRNNYVVQNCDWKPPKTKEHVTSTCWRLNVHPVLVNFLLHLVFFQMNIRLFNADYGLAKQTECLLDVLRLHLNTHTFNKIQLYNTHANSYYVTFSRTTQKREISLKLVPLISALSCTTKQSMPVEWTPSTHQF